MTESGRPDRADAETVDAAAADGRVWRRTLTVGTAEETQRLAAALAEDLLPGDLLLLDGPLGAGKTTFTQGLGRGLGVREGITSPTFVLARRHPNDPDGPRPGGPGLVHVDAYRLADAAAVEDIDLEETAAEWVTVVEWGRGKVERLRPSRLEIRLERPRGARQSVEQVLAGLAAEAVPEAEAPAGDQPRTLTVVGVGPRWADGPPPALA